MFFILAVFWFLPLGIAKFPIHNSQFSNTNMAMSSSLKILSLKIV